MSSQGSTNQSFSLGVSDPSSPENVLKNLALAFICLGSITGNTCVITAVVRSEKLQESPGSFLVGSLAIIDGFLMPVATIFQMAFPSAPSELACRFFSDYLVIVIYMVIWHLFLMSLDRFIVVVFPLRAHIMLTRRKVLYLLIPAWTLPVFTISIVPIILNTQDQGKSFRGKLLGCTDPHQLVQPELTPSLAHKLHVLLNILLFVVGPFLAMLVLYGKLSLISLNHENKNKVGADAANRETTANERRVKAKKIKEMKWAKTVGIVIGAFAVTYLPAFTCTLVEVQYGPGIIPQRVFAFFASVIFLNSATNAVIYSFRSVVYRREFKKIVRDLVRKFLPGFGAQEGHCFYIGSSEVAGSSFQAPQVQAQAMTRLTSAPQQTDQVTESQNIN